MQKKKKKKEKRIFGENIKTKIEMRSRIERLLPRATRQRRLRLLNKSVLSPGVRDTDGEGEGKEDESQGAGMERRSLFHRDISWWSVYPRLPLLTRERR